MLVVAFGEIMLTRMVLFGQNGIDVVERWNLRRLCYLPNFDLHPAKIGDIHFFGRTKHAVLKDRMNGHG